MGTATEYRFVNRRVLERRTILAESFRDGGLLALVQAAYPVDPAVWALGMTALFGPRGVRDHLCDDDGRPTLDARRRFPALDRAMRAAHRELLATLDLA